jgi:coenzyme F420-reducing hydrogenase delta subunit
MHCLPEDQKRMSPSEPKIVILACKWQAYQSLQDAARQHLSMPRGVRLLQIDCLGQVGARAILQALRKGADGVMLLGCAEEACHYEFGSRRADDVLAQARELASLLGFRQEQLALHRVGVDEGRAVAERVREFVEEVAFETPSEVEASLATSIEGLKSGGGLG